MQNTTIKPKGKYFNTEFEDQMNFPDPNSSFVTRMRRAKVKNVKNDKIVAKYFGETEENAK